MNLIEKVQGLREKYDEEALLEVVKEYSQKLKAEDIEVNLWFDAIDELLVNLDEKETTIDSILSDTEHVVKHYDEIVAKYKKTDDPKVEFAYRMGLGNPIYFLQVVYIFNSEKYTDNTCLWDFADNNKPFEKALEGEVTL